MSSETNFTKAKEHVFKDSPKDYGKDAIKIKGYDFSKPFNFEEFLKAYTSTGFQGANLGKAIEIAKKMKDKEIRVFLGCNSNMITSGTREIIKYMMQNKMIDVFVTTGGGIEEDIIKCLGDFYLGDFNANNEVLREKGINRTGNIFVPNQRYLDFEEFVQPILQDMLKEQKESGKVHAASELIKELGKRINNEESVLYWAWKNNIHTFCPSITDGSLGDQISFFKYNNKEFNIDVAADIQKLDELSITAKKTGIITLGSSAAKHHICNANQFRGGADYAIYITTETEEGGSDSGARVEEAISWGKVKAEAKHIKVYGDATIIFPLLVAGAFK